MNEFVYYHPSDWKSHTQFMRMAQEHLSKLCIFHRFPYGIGIDDAFALTGPNRQAQVTDLVDHAFATLIPFKKR